MQLRPVSKTLKRALERIPRKRGASRGNLKRGRSSKGRVAPEGEKASGGKRAGADLAVQGWNTPRRGQGSPGWPKALKSIQDYGGNWPQGKGLGPVADGEGVKNAKVVQRSW